MVDWTGTTRPITDWTETRERGVAKRKNAKRSKILTKRQQWWTGLDNY
jgi:hypothetical protein